MKKERTVTVEFVPLVYDSECHNYLSIYYSRLGCPDFEVEVSALKGLKPESPEANVLKKHKNCPKWAKVWPSTFYFTWDDFC
jgi:hypothetical protein